MTANKTIIFPLNVTFSRLRPDKEGTRTINNTPINPTTTPVIFRVVNFSFNKKNDSRATITGAPEYIVCVIVGIVDLIPKTNKIIFAEPTIPTMTALFSP